MEAWKIVLVVLLLVIVALSLYWSLHEPRLIYIAILAAVALMMIFAFREAGWITNFGINYNLFYNSEDNQTMWGEPPLTGPEALSPGRYETWRLKSAFHESGILLFYAIRQITGFYDFVFLHPIKESQLGDPDVNNTVVCVPHIAEKRVVPQMRIMFEKYYVTDTPESVRASMKRVFGGDYNIVHKTQKS